MTTILSLAAVLSIFAIKTGQGMCEELKADILQDMRNIEFGQIHYNTPADPYFSYIKGTIPILISAPHGAKHFRTKENRWKGEDAYTASLAIELGKLTGAHVLYVRNKAGEDPNNDPGTEYKKFLEKAVKENHIGFILDLHGSDSHRPYKVDVGILDNKITECSCPTYREIIAKNFSGFEPHLFNQNFSAHGRDTITYFAKNTLGIEAAQIEINANYRIVESKSSQFKADPKKVLELVRRLKDLILAVNESIKENTSRS
jgi:hypothetical protein